MATATDASTAAAVLQVKDRLDIMELTARYNQACLDLDPIAYADCFTEDGRYQHPQWNLDSVGRQALEGQVRDYGKKTKPGLQHFTTNPIISIEGDTAEQFVQLIVYGNIEESEPPRVIATGYYNDKIARTPDGWRFTHRISMYSYSAA